MGEEEVPDDVEVEALLALFISYKKEDALLTR
jgi:hypothetical protein